MLDTLYKQSKNTIQYFHLYSERNFNINDQNCFDNEKYIYEIHLWITVIQILTQIEVPLTNNTIILILHFIAINYII